MAKLPKSIIKKYGISKKAWKVFKSKKSSARKKSKSQKIKGVKPMARRRRYTKRRSYRRYSGTGNLTKVAMGAVGWNFIEPFADTALTRFGGSIGGMGFDDILKAVGGFYGMKKIKNPYLKGVAMGAFLSGINRLTSQLAGGLLGGSTAQTSNMVATIQ
jgi:hypothetical protein